MPAANAWLSSTLWAWENGAAIGLSSPHVENQVQCRGEALVLDVAALLPQGLKDLAPVGTVSPKGVRSWGLRTSIHSSLAL